MLSSVVTLEFQPHGTPSAVHRSSTLPSIHGSSSTTPYPVSPVESALTRNARVTPLQSALPEWLKLKSFRIRTYEKRRGRGTVLLTSIPNSEMLPTLLLQERGDSRTDLGVLATRSHMPAVPAQF